MEQRIPEHVAIIMDGNGRWAKKQKLPRTAGHLQGTKNIRNITIAANQMGIKSLTLYAFSTENWSRPSSEVEYIMRLPALFFEHYIEELMDHQVRIRLIGEIDRLPKYAKKPIEEAVSRTKDNTGLTLNLALNYGGRRELVLAIQQMIADGVEAKDIDEAKIGSYLMEPAIQDIDLMIRTSGESRISNFLLWQIAYAELIFCDALWPDYDEAAFRASIFEYQKRNRRFGGLKNEE